MVAIGLGIVAVVMGSVGLMVSWVPFLGLIALPVGAIGVVLAGVGLVMALTRKVNGLGLSILGGALCVVAAIIAIGSTSMGVAAVETALKEAVGTAVETVTSSALEVATGAVVEKAVDVALGALLERVDGALATVVDTAVKAIDAAVEDRTPGN